VNLLFIHPNMPGQYKYLARAFGAEGGHRIFFVTKHKTAEIPGVTRITYAMPKLDTPPPSIRYLAPTTRAIMQGQQVWRVCQALSTKENFTPDIIITHPGWGDALFLKDLFPMARILSFFEFYYRATGADVGFEDATTPDDHARVRMKNVTNLMNLEQADWGVAPTVWQWSLHPPELRQKVSVLHDGVDVDVCTPDMQATFTLPSGKIFKVGDEVVTYIARNFEPYRGFTTFMKAAEILLRERPNLHIIAIGADEVSYGRKAPDGKTYRQIVSEHVSLPGDRIHFIGTVAYAQLIKIYQISAAHMYLTYPFVLSWSMLEAMAAGAALVASDTKPVREVVVHGVNGLLADFFSAEDVAAKVGQLLDDPAHNRAMRAKARETVVERFALEKLLPLHMQLVREVAAGQIPPPVAEKIRAISPIATYANVMWEA
jgi:glycosyltransferase involved in cell wall biosynthesis